MVEVGGSGLVAGGAEQERWMNLGRVQEELDE